jgi:hypothetical protein
MQAVTTVGLDIAKSVFQFHGVAMQGKVIIRRRLKRRLIPQAAGPRRLPKICRFTLMVSIRV